MVASSRRLLVYFIILSICAAALFAFARRATATAVTKTVIVELKGEPAVVAKYRAEAEGRDFDVQAYRQQLVAEQDALLGRAAAAGINYVVSGVSAPNGEVTADIKFRFNYVYNGVTLEVPETAIPVLKGLEGVAAVHEAETMRPHLDHSVKYVRAPQLYGPQPHLTQFDTAATDGAHGEGMIVAVIDTGIDWTHPMFGGDATPPQFGVGPALATRNQKVIYYLNLTAGAVIDDFGHGTHVAADIAGYLGRAPGKDMIPLTADDVNVHGVAPQARLMGYKTLSTAGAGLNPSTIMAVEDAVQPFTIAGYPKPVPHVINLSLGSPSNDPNSPTSVACDNATLAGVTVVASAGNAGRPTPTNPTGEATIGSPGSGRRVLTVGANNDPGPPAEDIVLDRAFDNGRPSDRADVLDPAGVNRNGTGFVDGANKATAAGARTDIPFVLAGGSPTIGNPVAQYYVFAGTVTTAADVPDSVAGRIAVVRPSGAFAAISAAVAAKGAAGIVMVRPDSAKITVANSTVPVWSILESDARYLLDLLASHDAVGVDPAKGVLSEFPVRVKLGSFTPAMADFSSKGPVGGFGQVKPDVTAPGVGILSATVRAGGVSPAPSYMFHPSGYVSASGTSFSSPITAGVAALIKQKNPTWTPAMIRAALVNTATNLRWADGTAVADGVQSLNDQGGGLIDAGAAATAKALMGAGTPGPSGSAPAVRPNQICPNYGGNPSPLCGASPGNPDFSASHSFGQVAIAGVEGTATLSQAVQIHDVRGGAGAGTYQLSSSNVRNADGASFRVKFTDAGGNEISSVEVPEGGSAAFNVTTEAYGAQIAGPTQVQFYVTANRADGGQRLRMPFYYRAVAPAVTTAAPTLNSISGTEVADNPPVDIDGAYRVEFTKPAIGAQPSKLRVEESADGGATWATLADVDASQTTLDVSGRGNGAYQYRAVALYPVEYGLLAGPASSARAVRVHRRVETDVTSFVEPVNQNIVFGAGFTELTSALRNKSAGATAYPPARLIVTAINSGSGAVRVSNADNGGDGVGAPAVFDYTAQAGPDLTPGETSAARAVRFNNPNMELFTVTVAVRAHVPDPAFAAGGASASSGGEVGGGGAGTQQGASSGGGALSGAQTTLTFTVNPLTRTVRLK